MTKTDLRAYKALRKERDTLASQISELESVIYGPKAPNLDGMPRSNGGPRTHPADRLLTLREQYEAKVAELTDRMAEIEEAIQPLDPQERTLIRLHYFVGLNWEAVAVEMGYTWRHVQRLHGKALERLQETEATA